MRNKDLPIEEVAIAISSLVTKILISYSKIENEQERILFASAMNINRLNSALTNYSLYTNPTELLQCAKEVRELLQILYED